MVELTFDCALGREDGSMWRYNVLEDDVKELKADAEWIARYREW